MSSKLELGCTEVGDLSQSEHIFIVCSVGDSDASDFFTIQPKALTYITKQAKSPAIVKCAAINAVEIDVRCHGQSVDSANIERVETNTPDGNHLLTVT